MSHRLQEIAPEAYSRYQNYVFDTMAANGVDVQGELEGKRAFYAEMGEVLDDAGAREEYTADFTRHMIKTPEDFRRLVDHDRNLAQTIIDSIRKFIRTIKAALSGDKVIPQTGLTLSQLEKAERLWSEAFKVAEKQAEGMEQVGEREAMYSLKDNARYASAQDAINEIANGADEATAKNIRPDLSQYGGTGDITFIWGDEKKGIYHIGYRRGPEVVAGVLRAVLDGEVSRFITSAKRVTLELGECEAFLSLDRDGEKETWLLTGWQKNTPDAAGQPYSKPGATQVGPTFSRSDLGADVFNQIISHDGSNFKKSLKGEADYIRENKRLRETVALLRQQMRVTERVTTDPKKLEAFNGILIWALHMVSDMAGSSGSAGHGTGIPGPLLSLFKEASVLPYVRDIYVQYKEEKINLSVWLSKLYNGTAFPHKSYKDITRLDLRTELGIYAFSIKQEIPVIINQCAIRAFCFIKHLCVELKYKKVHSFSDFKKIEPKSFLPFNNRCIARMSTISTGVFSAVDMSDAALRAYLYNPKDKTEFATQFLLRLNFVGIGKFFFSLKADAGYIIDDVREFIKSKRIAILQKKLKLSKDSQSIWR